MDVHDEEDGFAVALARVGDHAQGVVVGDVDVAQGLYLWVGEGRRGEGRGGDERGEGGCSSLSSLLLAA